MPFTDDGLGATLFWSSGADPSFEDLTGRKPARATAHFTTTSRPHAKSRTRGLRAVPIFTT